VARARGPIEPSRSKKAGRPPEPVPMSPQARRRQKTAHAAVRKDTMLVQSPRDPRARWPASRPKFKKGG
jgi:hypothetical protein